MLTKAEIQEVEQTLTDALNLASEHMYKNAVVRRVPVKDVLCMCGGKLLEVALDHGATVDDLYKVIRGAQLGLSKGGNVTH